MSELNIAVLGAGVVGLTTAFELKNHFRNAKIDVIADKFNADTTSHVAAGLFRPGTNFSGPTEEITRKWINDSYNYWDDIRNSVEGSLAGVASISGYIFSSKYPNIVKNTYLEKLVPLYRRATEEELKLCPGNWKYGCFFTTILTQCSEFLPWISKKIEVAGCSIIPNKIESFSDIKGNYDVEAPWIKTFFYGDYDTYIIPGFHSVTLGGCRQYDSYDETVNKYDSLSIRERCESLLPSLKKAKVIAERVGLRPHRAPVRVEKEVKIINGKRLKIVHNYGHGGYGVTTAPGTSLYAVSLVREILSGNSKL
ncbi:D-aspartate oxidase [Asbolus verrucosus]|uniref:D-aspartate oxidase n=1 Tax=Asbolus verrucosus TaxID=1661398 RepID=A0A482W8V1_ASBVE|nr:D-aspartate oxidase [Asbolus verrucosus]